MATESRPQWQIELLCRESWTRLEFLCALCGRDLYPDERDAERQLAAGDPFAEPAELDADLQRAEESVDRAIQAGALIVNYFHAATTDKPFGDYHVLRDEAIRWATKIPGRFPHFPFPAERTAPDADAGVISEATGAPNPPVTGRTAGTLTEPGRESANPLGSSNVFRCRPDGRWEICYEGAAKVGLPHLEGFELIRRLLGNPDTVIDATELRGMHPADVSEGGPAIDPTARHDYMRRLREIDGERQKARDNRDRASEARRSELDTEARGGDSGSGSSPSRARYSEG